MKNIKHVRVFLVLICFLCSMQFSTNTFAEKALPNSLTAAILIKLIGYEKNSNNKKTVDIFVLGDESFAKELNKYIGKPIASTTLGSVRFGSELPDNPPDVLFIGKFKYIKSATNYTKTHKIMSVSYDPLIVGLGVSLLIFDDEGMPGVILNTSSSHSEGLSWTPEVLEIARTLQEQH